MEVRKFFCGIVLIIVWLGSVALADKVTVVVSNYNNQGYGWAGTADENDANFNAYPSYIAPAGKLIYSAGGNPNNGDIVLGFSDGTAQVAKYNSLTTVISSGAVADSNHGGGNGILGTTVMPDGNIYFGSYNGWVYARSRTNVAAVPAGYAAGSVQFTSSGSRYMFPTASPLSEIMIVSNDWGVVFLRQGNNMTAAVGAWDGMQLAASITTQLTLSTGDIVFASTAGNPSTYLFVRSSGDLSVAPPGYVDHAIMGTGTPIKALARTANDELLVGDNSGEVILCAANNVGVQLGYTVFFDSVTALAVTSDNNVWIGLHDGWVFVRSLSDIDGDDVLQPMYLGAGGSITAIIPYNPPTNCGQVIARGQGLVGDLNEDCYVNFKDVAIFGQQWLQ